MKRIKKIPMIFKMPWRIKEVLSGLPGKCCLKKVTKGWAVAEGKSQ